MTVSNFLFWCWDRRLPDFHKEDKIMSGGEQQDQPHGKSTLELGQPQLDKKHLY